MKKLFLNIMGGTLAIFACSTLMSACGSSEEPAENTRLDVVLSESSRSASEEMKDFYLRFTADAIKSADNKNDGNKTGNVVVSPLSASMMLGMLANGVEHDAALQIGEYIGVSDLNSLNSLASDLMKNLPNVDRKSELSLSNSVWYADDLNLSTDFSSKVSKSFKAHIQAIDFTQPTAISSIRNWIKSATSGMVNIGVNQANVNPQTSALILNAIHFKGEWNKEIFNSDNTKKATFHGFSGDSQVDMMNGRSYVSYAESENFMACRLYFGNNAFSILLLLPTDEAALNREMPDISEVEMDFLIKNMSNENIGIRLPKLSLKDNTNINNVMEIAGISQITGGTDVTMFEPATRKSVFMQQESSFTINEKGAEIVSVSSAEILVGAAPINGMLEFNRPFYFFLNENSTGTCILSGRITDL